MRSHKSELCAILFKLPSVGFVSIMCLRFLVALSSCSLNPFLLAFSPPIRWKTDPKTCALFCAPRNRVLGCLGRLHGLLTGGPDGRFIGGQAVQNRFRRALAVLFCFQTRFTHRNKPIWPAQDPVCRVSRACWRSTSPLWYRSNARSLDGSIARPPTIAVLFESSDSCLSAHFKVYRWVCAPECACARVCLCGYVCTCVCAYACACSCWRCLGFRACTTHIRVH